MYEIVPVPPLALKVNEPFAPLHNALAALAVITTEVGSVTVTTVEEVQALASVATTVYVPAVFVYGLV